MPVRRDHSQLLHYEAKEVVLCPSLYDLSTIEPVNHNAGHLDLLSGRLDTLELAGLRPGPAHSHHDPVSLSDQIVDNMGAVRVRARKHLERLLDTFKSGLEIGNRRWIVIDKIGGEELIQRG